jgi:acyl-coenzyme A thioesterase PaaI-like protein
MNWTPSLLKILLRFYPPYFGAGIRITHISPDWRELRVVMKLRWYNRNIVGTQFGGSLYSMIDPHLMLLLMQRLGPEYTVWDKGAEIEFVRPGRGTVTATIAISDAELDEIRKNTADGRKYLPEFTLNIVDDDGGIVAKVRKILYVRRKLRKEPIS